MDMNNDMNANMNADIFNEILEITGMTGINKINDNAKIGKNICTHYTNNCKIIAPCCKKIFSCRLCHDEQVQDHKIDRFNIKELVCSECENVQENINNACTKCNNLFGTYFCSSCNVIDNMNKKQFHCDKCKICRIGGIDNFIHCDKCNICLNKKIYDSHKCIDASTSNCPICFDELFGSVSLIQKLNCGHFIHSKCMLGLLNRSYKCPLCMKSMIDLTKYNEMMDKEVELTIMPDEYKDMDVNILCNDCEKTSTSKFHILGNKCVYCKGYNVRKI